MGQFVAELRRLSEYCEFGGSLDEMLRDRLVCGLRDVRVQRRLFAEPKLTFTKAFELAQAAELAEKSSHDISRAGASVNDLGVWDQGGRQLVKRPTILLLVSVAELGTVLQNVVSGLWSATNAVKRGIWQERAAARNKQLKNSSVIESTNLLAEPLEKDEDVEDMYTLFNVSDVSLAPFRVPMEINKASLEMEVDTGAAASVISEVTYKTLWKGKCNERPPLKHTNALLRTYILVKDCEFWDKFQFRCVTRNKKPI